MASSRSSSDRSSGGAVEVSRAAGRSPPCSVRPRQELRSVGSSSASSPVNSNNGRPSEKPVDLMVEQTNAPAESGDVISIDVADEGE